MSSNARFAQKVCSFRGRDGHEREWARLQPGDSALAAVRGEDVAVMDSQLLLCRVCGRMAILFRVSILLTPGFANYHGFLPLRGVQRPSYV
jgi:hypothetical protein